RPSEVVSVVEGADLDRVGPAEVVHQLAGEHPAALVDHPHGDPVLLADARADQHDDQERQDHHEEEPGAVPHDTAQRGRSDGGGDHAAALRRATAAAATATAAAMATMAITGVTAAEAGAPVDRSVMPRSAQPLGVRRARRRRRAGAVPTKMKEPPSRASANVRSEASPSACCSVRVRAMTRAVSAVAASAMATTMAATAGAGPQWAPNANDVATATVPRLAT